VRHHAERVHAGVGAPGGVHRPVPPGQGRERVLHDALDGPLARRLPLPTGEAAAVELEGQPDAPQRRQAVRRRGGTRPKAAPMNGATTVTDAPRTK
jgi:hypothetical protein